MVRMKSKYSVLVSKVVLNCKGIIAICVLALSNCNKLSDSGTSPEEVGVKEVQVNNKEEVVENKSEHEKEVEKKGEYEGLSDDSYEVM